MSGTADVPLWHVTLTLAGAEHPPCQVRGALERLAFERPFILTVRYSAERAEIRYWEEASTLAEAGSLALQVWSQHRESACLPPWRVVGLEVLDRDTYRHRRDAGPPTPAPLASAGDIRPF